MEKFAIDLKCDCRKFIIILSVGFQISQNVSRQNFSQSLN
jgi:hypothetical protein